MIGSVTLESLNVDCLFCKGINMWLSNTFKTRGLPFNFVSSFLIDNSDVLLFHLKQLLLGKNTLSSLRGKQ